MSNFHKLEQRIKEALVNHKDQEGQEHYAQLLKWQEHLQHRDIMKIYCDDYWQYPDCDFLDLVKLPYDLCVFSLPVHKRFPIGQEYPEGARFPKPNLFFIVQNIEDLSVDSLPENFEPRILLSPCIVSFEGMSTIWFPSGYIVLGVLDGRELGMSTGVWSGVSESETQRVHKQLGNLFMDGGFQSHFKNLLCFLNAENITLCKVTPDKKFIKSRKKKGRSIPKEYSVLKLPRQPNIRYQKSQAMGSMKSRHWRRGHMRRLNNGGVTWIAPCLINPDSNVESPSTKHIKLT